jgi:hypothetical protein
VIDKIRMKGNEQWTFKPLWENLGTLGEFPLGTEVVQEAAKVDQVSYSSPFSAQWSS